MARNEEPKLPILFLFGNDRLDQSIKTVQYQNRNYWFNQDNRP